MKLVYWTTMVAALLLAPALVHAVPSFARQTGLECVSCHLSWLELSSVGREFKLGGYTLMKDTKEERPWLPMQSDGPPPRLPLAAVATGVMVCCVRTFCTSTTGLAPVTVTVSSSDPTFRSALIAEVVPRDTSTPSRANELNPDSVNVTL